ncbi:type VI secretion system baseplate subunit TssG [Pseudoalteromonas denitrificans]|uniref:Predicted component of the type VI protein secretion system n=1 Tax=Pseudoalteromonas denitrificans DSM 6059 TaxID=1123010 RepID=A0A1I1GU23_9GAMM|nr:type VI secretion system baseplate subunit TssG [Pseudoalteromonas denitrificans]SFC12540.1 Predicted component of the type VI protein secretion system [Pseudoalteromonas denitrificans DSM 6059]
MSLIQQAQAQPDKFELVQLIRIINRHLAKTEQAFELIVEADPMPNNMKSQISEFKFLGKKAIISSSKTSLTSGDTVVPVYIYEELLKAFHGEDYALFDFLNIFNDRYFKLFARTVEKTHLLLTDEIDRYFKDARQKNSQVHLANSIAQLTSLPNSPQTKNWLGYSLMLGLPNRSQQNLQQILSDYFELNITTFCTHLSKHQLTHESWTKLGAKKNINNASSGGQNNQLGQGFLLGQRCWLSKQKINITVEVKNEYQLHQLTSDNNWFKELADMTRYYLRDKTQIGIFLKAPDSWFERTKLSTKQDETVCLGRGFHIKSTQQDKPVVYLIHLVKD